MADKSVSELVEASRVTATDLFVLEQNGEAKKLSGQTLENWLLEMAEGKGGIQKIEKTASSGLVDTYRITFSDTSTFIYTVTNGAQGEPGAKTYLWIKYSDQKPTSNADIYDTPDNWMGIYTGDASAPPVEYTQYTWFQIKGEPGPTGSAAVVTESEVTYQVGNSGTTVPSGTWQSSIPLVSQGKYLWSRTTVRFNTGAPVVTYSVARMGLDGTGIVSSVNNISPDDTGNIQLKASDIGAIPTDGVPDPQSPNQPANKNYVDSLIAGTVKMLVLSVFLSASGWRSNEQTVTANGVPSDDEMNAVIATPAPASHVAYYDANVRCTAQAAGALTFTCDDVPTAALTVNVLILTTG